jgi:hypothetical protein
MSMDQGGSTTMWIDGMCCYYRARFSLQTSNDHDIILRVLPCYTVSWLIFCIFVYRMYIHVGENPDRNGVVSRSDNKQPAEQEGARALANGLFIELLPSAAAAAAAVSN